MWASKPMLPEEFRELKATLKVVEIENTAIDKSSRKTQELFQVEKQGQSGTLLFDRKFHTRKAMKAVTSAISKKNK